MNRSAGLKRGLTLIELLVVFSVIALLLAILLPALRAGRHAAYDLKCKANLRNVLVEFRLFVDDSGPLARGDSANLPSNRFRIEDFQERLYRISEFWDGPAGAIAPLDRRTQAMMCPSSPGNLLRRPFLSCSEGAVLPVRNVSMGFNMRLHMRTALVNSGGGSIFAPAYPTETLLQHPEVPLLFDVDGETASSRNLMPYYSAPSSGRQDLYGDNRRWFPALRHRGRMNVGFVGGHVLSTPDPLREPWWDWDYQPGD